MLGLSVEQTRILKACGKSARNTSVPPNKHGLIRPLSINTGGRHTVNETNGSFY